MKDRLRATNVEILEKETRVNGTTGSICWDNGGECCVEEIQFADENLTSEY